MSVDVYYTAAEAYENYDESGINADLLYKVSCFDGDCFNVEIKTVVHTNNMDELFESIKKTITEMSKKA